MWTTQTVVTERRKKCVKTSLESQSHDPSERLTIMCVHRQSSGAGGGRLFASSDVSGVTRRSSCDGGMKLTSSRANE